MSRITLFAHGILAVVLAANSSPVFGAADKGHDDDGGASIVRNGLVLTFGDVRIPLHVPNGPGGLYDIPGLQEATQGVQNLPLGLQSLGGQLLTALHPTETILNARQYFTIDEADISSSTIKKLKKEYGTVRDNLKIPGKDKIALFAMTSGNDTYLLPDFFKIVDQNGKPDPKAQAAILFHEALDVVPLESPNPSVAPSESQAVNLEIAFENYIKGGNEIPLLYAFFNSPTIHAVYPYGENLGSSVIAAAYFRYDLKTGVLGDLVNADGDFNLMSLAGPSDLQISQSFTDPDRGGDHPDAPRTFYTNAQYNFPTDVLNGLIQKHPRSLFLAFLSLNSGNLSLDLSPPMKDSERIETYSSPMDDGERSQCIDAGGVVGQDVDDCLYSSSEEPKSADVNSLDGNVLHSSTPLWISLKDPTPSDFLQLSLPQTLNNVQCFASRHNTRNQKDPLCPSGLIQANSSSTIAQENFTLQWGGYDGSVTLIDENIVESVLH